jgi:hypothetical protein
VYANLIVGLMLTETRVNEKVYVKWFSKEDGVSRKNVVNLLKLNLEKIIRLLHFERKKREEL